ncbi:uncharacterized protein LAESUDRAFT_724031 [Laetiporus sulphureus 93-53]|uniref:F-box domain-containing protein n=1 Tax=Laetiporus sulphureus 93-53 TaxID=1314785 RepID=A0A165EZJ9_9APHY|nr:uncharacterized protein LAESUDRAFT_724031 [Laetiporus sulphureus 93-53]KZT08049.1 hypothetical protein LAESUDRAFT_724031 [Laetiporus sulphureus 93-53]
MAHRVIFKPITTASLGSVNIVSSRYLSGRNGSWFLLRRHIRSYALRDRDRMDEEYRIMRAPFRLRRLWDRLAEDRSLASVVENLEIQREVWLWASDPDPPKVPQDYMEEAVALLPGSKVTEEDDIPHLRETEKSLVRALRNMSNLKGFKWGRVPPLIDARYDVDASEDLWTALRSIDTLRELEVVDASDPSQCVIRTKFGLKWHRRVHDSGIFTLGHLTVFKYATFGYNGQSERIPTEAMTDMLVNRCADLRELELSFAQFNNQEDDDIALDFTSTGLNTLFTLANWPQLESIGLYGAHMRPDSLSQFLTRHRSLRSFRVMESCTPARFLKADEFPLVQDGSIMDKFSFPEDTFSELSSLSVPSYFISWVLSSPHRKLLALEDIGWLESEHMTDELFMLLGELPRLRVLRMSSYEADDLRALSSYAPGLREIYGSINPRSLAHVLDAFALFPQLEVVDNYASWPQRLDEEETPRLLARLGGACSNLRRFHGYDIGRTVNGDVVARNVRTNLFGVPSQIFV